MVAKAEKSNRHNPLQVIPPLSPLFTILRFDSWLDMATHAQVCYRYIGMAGMRKRSHFDIALSECNVPRTVQHSSK